VSGKSEVSIVVPTLNEEAYIERTLKSLKDQEFAPRYEIVIGDSYSTDRTLSICSKYADKIVLEKKRTPGAGRQAAARKSEGRVLAFCCADSVYPPDWLRELTLPILEERAEAVGGIVLPYDGSFFDYIGSKYILAPLTWSVAKLGLYFTPGETIAVSRKAFDQVGGFNVNMVTAEDLDLVKRISKVGRVRINPKAKAFVSMRRVRKWGRVRYVAYHVSNYLSYHLLRNSYARYEPVR